MTKKKQPKKLKTRSAKAKKTAKRAVAKATKAKKVIKKTGIRRGVERREFRRISTRNLWVTELSGDYQFVAQARDISQGGIFLSGRMKTSQSPSIIRIQFNGQPIELVAQPVYDQVSNKNYGTGYQFLNLTTAQTKTLKSFLSSLR